MANVENKCCYKLNIQNFCITWDIKIDVSGYNFNFRILKCRNKGKHPGEILFQCKCLLSPIFFLSLQIHASHASSLTIPKAPDFRVCFSAPRFRQTFNSSQHTLFSVGRRRYWSAATQQRPTAPLLPGRICFPWLLF